RSRCCQRTPPRNSRRPATALSRQFNYIPGKSCRDGFHDATNGLISNGNFLAWDLLLRRAGLFVCVWAIAMEIDHVTPSYAAADRLCAAAEAKEDRAAKEPHPDARRAWRRRHRRGNVL